jgi:signal peptidase
MKLFKKTVNAIFSAMAVIGLAILVMFSWSATGWKALVIPTKSMRPSIPPGSLVLVHSVPVSSLKIGDVITYSNPLIPTETVTHRLIAIKSNRKGSQVFITKGDANSFADVPFGKANIKGKVVWHIPYIGSWLMKAKKPLVILPIVYGAALLIMIDEIIRLRDYLKTSQPYDIRRVKWDAQLSLPDLVRTETIDKLLADYSPNLH